MSKHKVLSQPPSGGCVLKLLIICEVLVHLAPAAFGRLCVETANADCAELASIQPPSGGCVLKHVVQIHQSAAYLPSRLRAAVC